MKKRTYPCRVKPVRHELELLCVILVVSVPKSCSDETTKQNCSYRTVGVSQQWSHLVLGRILISRRWVGLSLLLGVFDCPAACWKPIRPERSNTVRQERMFRLYIYLFGQSDARWPDSPQLKQAPLKLLLLKMVENISFGIRKVIKPRSLQCGS